MTHFRPFRSAGGVTQRWTIKGSLPFCPSSSRRSNNCTRSNTCTPLPLTPKLCFRKKTSDPSPGGGFSRKSLALQVSGWISLHPASTRRLARVPLSSKIRVNSCNWESLCNSLTRSHPFFFKYYSNTQSWLLWKGANQWQIVGGVSREMACMSSAGVVKHPKTALRTQCPGYALEKKGLWKTRYRVGQQKAGRTPSSSFPFNTWHKRAWRVTRIKQSSITHHSDIFFWLNDGIFNRHKTVYLGNSVPFRTIFMTIWSTRPSNH